MRTLTTPCLLALALALAPSTAAQEPAAPAAQEPVLKATVNGKKIFESDLEEKLRELFTQNLRGMEIPEEQLEQQLASIRPQYFPILLERMIDEILLDAAVAKAELQIAEDAYAKFLSNNLAGQLVHAGMSRADFEEALQSREKIGVDEFVKRESSLPEFRSRVRHLTLVKQLYPEAMAVPDDEIQARYDRDKEQVYTRPELVTASHILVGLDGAKTDEEKAAKRAEAERIEKLCKAEGADFAALAREHSTGPSGPNGGALGSFPRTGKMVEPFAKAAFELAVNEVSGVVETQFGYHVIKVTGRTEGRVIPFDEAKPWIRNELLIEKGEPQVQAHVKKLREAAEISYPEKKG